MRPKEMKNSAAFSAREVMRAVAKEREKEKCSLQKDGESRSERQSHSNKLSENCRKGYVRWGRKTGERGTISRISR